MRLFFSVTSTMTLLIICNSVLAAAKNKPEAYAGLNDAAYHAIQLNSNKQGNMSFKLDGIEINIKTPQQKSATKRNFSFTQNLKYGFISATQGNNSLFGQIHLNNKHYILTTDTSGIWAVELPQSGIKFNDCGIDHYAQNAMKVEKTNIPQYKSASTIIDILVIHDQAIADRYPDDLLSARVDQYIHVSNQTYANSNIDLGLRLIGLEQVPYYYNDSNFLAREKIQQSLATGHDQFGLENLNNLVNSLQPDLVIFLRTHNIETRGSCGIAYFPVSNESGGYYPSYGVNVMADGMSSWSICTDQLMVHEIGHNLGAGHHNATPFGEFPDDAKGFAKLGQFSTVMGAFPTGQPERFFELNYFSNPNIRCGGGACGIAGQTNNAKTINHYKSKVASYRTSSSNAPLPDSLPIAITDYDGDGIPDSEDAFPFDATESKDTDGDSIGDVADAFPNQANEQSDFDNDGLGDNADSDDDNDGILDNSDAFPYDDSESKDSDLDGVGDNTDDFVYENTEFIDADGDGLGNNSDNDDDNDGVIDLSNQRQDLLVISVGNNRILRFDAQTGQAKGIEVLPSDGLLTFQSDMAYDSTLNQLFFTSSSSIKILDLQDINAQPRLLIPAYSNSQLPLSTGFPTALETNNNRVLITATMDATWIDFYGYKNFNKPSHNQPAILNGVNDENIIDLYKFDNQVYALGKHKRLYKGDLNGDNIAPFGPVFTWFRNPYAFVITPDHLLLNTNQSRNNITIIDAETGKYKGIFADLSLLRFSNPTGIELTTDGRLLVAIKDQDTIIQFDAESGNFMGQLVTGMGLSKPHKILLVPQLNDRFHQDKNKVLRPNAGNWFNPATSGRGFNIGIFENQLQVLWFTYDEQGAPIWYTSASTLIGHNYQADLLKTTLDAFGTINIKVVGQLDIQFINERQANVNWQIGGVNGEEEISWLQFSTEPELENYTGMWAPPDTPGWGIAVTTIGEQSFSIPFVYDAAGEPRWAISDVVSGTQPLNFNLNSVFSDSLCPSCSGTSYPTLVPAGSLSLNLSEQATWSSQLNWTEPLSGDWLLDHTPIIRISGEPSKPR